MGRRKIEIKAIKDDRNRSVTFLKRKGGLFKKAHELSVLCSVDVAVIIFGHNKKLYEFSSGDINETIGRYQYYGGAHEHKGPEDFMGKKDMDDDEEDEEAGGSPPPNSHSPPEHAMMPHHLQHQPQFQHIPHATPSASPPMPNGIPFQHRGASPQPSHGISRPNSRAAHVRRNSNLAPPHHQSQPPPPQNSYAYMPNPPFYNPQAQQNMPQKPPPPPQPPHYQYTHPPPPQTHPQVQYLQQEQRRQSMPPTFSQAQERPNPPAPQAPMQHPQPPQPPPPQQSNQQSPPQSDHNNFQSPPMPQPKALPTSKKHSIFTPIEDSHSMLAAHWGRSTEPAPRSEPPLKVETSRPQSIDNGSAARQHKPPPPPPPPPAQHQKPQQNGNSPQPASQQLPQPPQRTSSASSVPTIGPPSRTNSMTNGPPRPRLKVQIPSEQSDNGSATAESSPKDTGTTGATPAKTSTENSHGSAVVLPPPSPSGATTLLSAGATGPPNPFARPPPPGAFSNRDNMETPISALPSRFVDNLLPSPSSFYPEWGFGRDSNMLPSPLNFQTPVIQNGPSFRDDDDRKRKTSDPDEVSQAKRIKA